jgi:hypothetical protein
MSNATIRIRPGRETDWKHVTDSFSAEYRFSVHGAAMSESIRRAAIGALLRSKNWTLAIAYPGGDSDLIYGWILYSGRSVAWVSVKDGGWRRKGFARALLKHAGIGKGNVNTPFVPKDVEEISGKGWIIRHRPHLLLREILAP